MTWRIPENHNMHIYIYIMYSIYIYIMYSIYIYICVCVCVYFVLPWTNGSSHVFVCLNKYIYIYKLYPEYVDVSICILDVSKNLSKNPLGLSTPSAFRQNTPDFVRCFWH